MSPGRELVLNCILTVTPSCCPTIYSLCLRVSNVAHPFYRVSQKNLWLGYLVQSCTLSGIPCNNPSKASDQLWFMLLPFKWLQKNLPTASFDELKGHKELESLRSSFLEPFIGSCWNLETIKEIFFSGLNNGGPLRGQFCQNFSSTSAALWSI